jgi:hypothetical protein
MKRARLAGKRIPAIGVKCLSIRQPWAWLIVNGHKDVENRTWKTKHRGPLLIHAGQRPVLDFDAVRQDVLRRFRIKIPDELDYGGIVGQATVVDCVTESDSPWFWGHVGFVCEDAMRLPFVPMKGRLGIFPVDPGIVRRLRSGVRRARRQLS